VKSIRSDMYLHNELFFFKFVISLSSVLLLVCCCHSRHSLLSRQCDRPKLRHRCDVNIDCWLCACMDSSVDRKQVVQNMVHWRDLVN
jgi:hypothetical protein